jgi:hypothetical protein
VRSLEKQLGDAVTTLAKYGMERRILAKLAAKGAAFFNPLDVFAAEKVRDEILATMNMNPDGSFKK